MSVPTPDCLRKEVLRLDMHEVPPAEIARRLGVNRSTTEQIILRTRGPRENAHRGNITLLYNPAGTLRPGARFNLYDLNSMAELSGLLDGTLFKVTRRDGSTYRVEVQGGELVRCQ